MGMVGYFHELWFYKNFYLEKVRNLMNFNKYVNIVLGKSIRVYVLHYDAWINTF